VTTSKGTLIGVRILDEPLAVLDSWIAKQDEKDLSRPKAIHRLVELGLKAKLAAKAVGKPGRRLRAQNSPPRHSLA
jgi:hypothetical protein